MLELFTEDLFSLKQNDFLAGYTLWSSIVNLAGTSLAAKFLRENGITLFKVREETVKLLGKSDMYFFSPEHPPLTEPAQKALDWAVEEKLKSGTCYIYI